MMKPGYFGFVMGLGGVSRLMVWRCRALDRLSLCYCTKYVSASTKLRLSMGVPQL